MGAARRQTNPEMDRKDRKLLTLGEDLRHKLRKDPGAGKEVRVGLCFPREWPAGKSNKLFLFEA